jgi:hypothetical protein
LAFIFFVFESTEYCKNCSYFSFLLEDLRLFIDLNIVLCFISAIYLITIVYRRRCWDLYRKWCITRFSPNTKIYLGHDRRDFLSVDVRKRTWHSRVGFFFLSLIHDSLYCKLAIQSFSINWKINFRFHFIVHFIWSSWI